MLNILFANTRMIWIFPTAYKQAPDRIIQFVLTTFKNENHPCIRVRVGEDSALEKSTYVTNLLVDEFRLSCKLLVIMPHVSM